MMRKSLKSLTPILLAVCLPDSVNGETEIEKSATRGYVLWKCAALATLAGHDEEKITPYFMNGHALLSTFITDMIERKVTDEQLNNIPVGILWNLSGGPSVDFRLGVIWARIVDDQFNRTRFEDSGDKSKELQQHKAELDFMASNCNLLLTP